MSAFAVATVVYVRMLSFSLSFIFTNYSRFVTPISGKFIFIIIMFISKRSQELK